MVIANSSHLVRQLLRLKSRAYERLLPIAFLAAMFNTVSAQAQPQGVWLAPLIHHRPDNEAAFRQTRELIRHPEAWSKALAATHVLKLFIWETDHFPDELLGEVFRFLRDRKIKLALELPPLTLGEPGDCGWATEGYVRRDSIRNWMQRIRKNGGTLDYIAMDEPLFYGSVFPGDASHRNPCKSPINAVAQDAAENLAVVRQYFPNVLVGDIEPLQVVDGRLRPSEADIVSWATEFQRATGQPLAFMHYDLVMSPELPALAKQVIARLQTKLPVQGVILNGAEAIQSDHEWSVSVDYRERAIHELMGMGLEIVLQDWKPYPERIVPDTDPDTFFGAYNFLFDAPGNRVSLSPLFLVADPSDGTSRRLASPKSAALGAGGHEVGQVMVFSQPDRMANTRPLLDLSYVDARGKRREAFLLEGDPALERFGDDPRQASRILGYALPADSVVGVPIYRAFNRAGRFFFFSLYQDEYAALPEKEWRKDGVVARFPRI